VNFDKCPFPFFGGKSQAAPAVWAALGDVRHFVEPFAGSLAVLLGRPHPINRHNHSETVNDVDGLLVNAWRAIQLAPEETAVHASWPVAEADLVARHLALVNWRAERQLEHLMGDPLWYDERMAGWWLNGLCQWIGTGWCDGRGKWVVGDDDRIRPRRPDEPRPGDATGADETPGVARQLPQLGNDGRGVNQPGVRDGTPGVARKLLFLGNNGRGINHPDVRDGTPGYCRNGGPWHPSAPDITSTVLVEWFQHLAQRLRWVRIVNGDWTRVVTGGAINSLPVRMKKGGCAGIFLDPPYADTAGRDPHVYTHDSPVVAHAVREWALAHGNEPKWRIVMAGFEGEHGDAFTAAGWREVEWFKQGYLSGGMGNVKANGTHQQGRERLWLSPNCLEVSVETGVGDNQPSLWRGGGRHIG